MTMCVCVGEFLEDIHQSEESKLSPLCREITDNRVKSRKELDGLYQKIPTYILQRSAMGSPTDTNTMEEATGLILLFIVPTTMSCLHTENVMPRYTKGCATNSNPRSSRQHFLLFSVILQHMSCELTMNFKTFLMNHKSVHIM